MCTLVHTRGGRVHTAYTAHPRADPLIAVVSYVGPEMNSLGAVQC